MGIWKVCQYTTGSKPAISAAKMVPVSEGLQSRHRVVAMAAVAEIRDTPRATRIGNMVTMRSIARPEALLMARPRNMPSTQQALMTM